MLSRKKSIEGQSSIHHEPSTSLPTQSWDDWRQRLAVRPIVTFLMNEIHSKFLEKGLAISSDELIAVSDNPGQYLHPGYSLPN